MTPKDLNAAAEDDLQEKFERIKNANQNIKAENNKIYSMLEAKEVEISKLEADKKILRDALKNIADAKPGANRLELRGIAIQALEQTGGSK